MNKTNRIGNSLDRVTRNNREQKKTYIKCIMQEYNIYVSSRKKGSFNFTEDLVCHIEVRAFFIVSIFNCLHVAILYNGIKKNILQMAKDSSHLKHSHNSICITFIFLHTKLLIKN